MDYLRYIADKFERAVKESVGSERLQGRLDVAYSWFHAFLLEEF